MERVVTPPFPDPVRDPTVAGVVLAAGHSERFGDADKLLADYDGRPLVAHAIETLRESVVDSVTVVVRSDRVREVARECGADTVDAPEDAGQSASVCAGVDAVRGDADAVLVALGDMPEVRIETVDALVAAYRAGVADALAAGHDGCRGNPVLFDERHFDALTGIDGDRGGRNVLRDADSGAVVDTDDPGTCYDVDHPDDLPVGTFKPPSTFDWCMEGIYARQSDYLERYVQLGVASQRLISVSFPQVPDEDAGSEHALLDRIFAYFEGVEDDFDDVEVGLTVPTTQREVLEAVRGIPYGEQVSVAALARMTPGLDPDDDEDLDEVRTALAENPVPLVIPDHRVRDGPSGAPPEVEQKLRALEDL